MTLAALLVLAGCATPGGGGSQVPSTGGSGGSATTSQVATAQPTTARPTTAQPGTQPSTTRPTTVPATTVPATTDPALDGYSGPQPMPASDGLPMLWPTTAVNFVPALYGDDWRYGFVDVNGDLVIPPRYSGYQYCPDATGRAAFLIANRPGARAVVFDLTGKRLLRTPTTWADCGGPGHVIFTREGASETGIHRSGLLELATGDVVLPMAPDRHILVLDSNTLNVSDPAGEFYFDLATGARTPHAGWLSNDAELDAGAPAAPATKVRQNPYDYSDPRLGYVDPAGHWVVTPTLESATSFMQGHAIVQDRAGFTFLDADLKRVGGTWDEIDTVERSTAGSWRLLGYLLTRGDTTSLLDPELRTLVEPGVGKLACDWYDLGTCTLVRPDGGAELVTLPGGARTPLPEGYTEAFGRSFAGAFVANPKDDPDGDTSVVGVYALAAGRVAATGSWNGCEAVAADWLSCEPRAAALPPLVLDTQGRQTRFREVTAVDDPVPDGGAAYYWVIAGRYRGFVDATGAWRYRESRYNQLED